MYFLDHGRSEWKPDKRSDFDQNLFRPDNRPPSLQEFYDACDDPPQLSLLNRFSEDGVNAEKKYSNPMFFFESWLEGVEKKNEEAKKANKERAKARKAKKKQAGKDTQKKVVKKVRRYKYDPETGKKILIESNDDTPDETNDNVASRNVQSNVSALSAPSFSQDSKKHKISTRNYSAMKRTAPRPAVVPSAPAPAASTSVPSAPGVVAPSPSAPAPAPVSFVAPAPAPIVAAPPPPPPPPKAPAPPPMAPMAPKMPAARIVSQAPEQEHAQPESAPVGGTSSLMSSIRTGVKLKSAQERTISNAPVKNEGLSVAAILARRIAIADSDDEEDDDDEDWSD